jgi:tRNA nucleotidyltransferase (CCA-adding enzyme)
MEMLKEIARRIESAGGKAYLVGGAVRDHLMGLPLNDFDVEVFKMQRPELLSIIREFGNVKSVGESFGIDKLYGKDGLEYDFAFPRRDRKSGISHTDFEVEIDPYMTVGSAQARRNYTINAIYMDILSGEIIDTYGGVFDIKHKHLRHLNGYTFTDDPLRVLIGVQQAGRFDLESTWSTEIAMKSMKKEFHTISAERVWKEMWKWASLSIKPSKGLLVLEKSEWLENWPRFHILSLVPQDKLYHPEGDVWAHTKYTVDAAANIAIRDSLNEEARGVLVLAALLHDTGKATTTVVNEKNGKVTSYGHAYESSIIAYEMMDDWKAPHSIRDRVVELVFEHMVATDMPNKKSVRHLLSRLQLNTPEMLVRLIEADHSGRPPLSPGVPLEAVRILEIAEEINGEIKPLVLGRHLIAMGMKPGNHFGVILKELYERQLNGDFSADDFIVYTMGYLRENYAELL